MSSDDAIRQPDVRFRAAGPGLSQSFKCGQCQQHRSMQGRRLLKVRLGRMKGMRAWCCAECTVSERIVT